ncbi:hypothetical protein [Metapseudomonas resinovorans]|uniref:Uncharacterized protein n=1 Tax=Metapseudomonas resinovorans NBRC 106553 TaxID=1245471 RepID=S6BGP8_METRE|nr:hypothetical protein [Pseudomonas resinovorans]BAN48279.1 hypothetical protein PCA10_25470 [Pseudomonas resinovorans NBRC 106553]
MQFKQFTEEEVRLVRHATHDTHNLLGRAKTILQKIKSVFDSEYAKEEWGVNFDLQNDGNVAIDTPYGEARIRLVFSVDEKGSRCQCLVEKVELNRQDQKEWIPVWAIWVTELGVFPGSEIAPPMPTFGNSNGYAMLALSILYAVARGPEK